MKHILYIILAICLFSSCDPYWPDCPYRQNDGRKVAGQLYDEDFTETWSCVNNLPLHGKEWKGLYFDDGKKVKLVNSELSSTIRDEVLCSYSYKHKHNENKKDEGYLKFNVIDTDESITFDIISWEPPELRLYKDGIFYTFKRN